MGCPSRVVPLQLVVIDHWQEFSDVDALMTFDAVIRQLMQSIMILCAYM